MVCMLSFALKIKKHTLDFGLDHLSLEPFWSHLHQFINSETVSKKGITAYLQ